MKRCPRNNRSTLRTHYFGKISCRCRQNLFFVILSLLVSMGQSFSFSSYKHSNYAIIINNDFRPQTKSRTSLLFSSKPASPNDALPKRRSSSSKYSPPTSRSVAVFALFESIRRQIANSKKKRNRKENNNVIAQRILEQDPNYQSNDMEPRDRALARLLLTTAERRHGQIDAIINQFVHKKNQNDDASVKSMKPSEALCHAALVIGVTQLIFLDTPAFAATHETVEVLRMHPTVHINGAQIKFVNAILRNIGRKIEEEEGKHGSIINALLDRESVLKNVHPELLKAWLDAYGQDSTYKIVEAAMEQSPIFLTVNTNASKRENSVGNNAHKTSTQEERRCIQEELCQRLTDSSIHEDQQAELLPQGSIRVPEQTTNVVSKWPGYQNGDWWVQDPSATLPAIALENAILHQQKVSDQKIEDMHAVDLCSAPGGKTAQLCAMGFQQVTAVEISSRRMKTLHKNLDRLGMMNECEIVVADGTTWQPADNSMVDAILLDAPCSATGLGSRRPDVLQKAPQFEELITLQRELAVHAITHLLKPGGVLVYATCSLLKSESEDQMSWLLSNSSTCSLIKPIPFQSGEIPGFDTAIDENGWLRIIPGHLPGTLSQCDGFFVARFQKL